MVFTNASNLFNQAMLISIQEHMHKVGFLNGGNSATEINRLYTQTKLLLGTTQNDRKKSM